MITRKNANQPVILLNFQYDIVVVTSLRIEMDHI